MHFCRIAWEQILVFLQSFGVIAGSDNWATGPQYIGMCHNYILIDIISWCAAVFLVGVHSCCFFSLSTNSFL